MELRAREGNHILGVIAGVGLAGDARGVGHGDRMSPRVSPRLGEDLE
eukprot:CAMPEP_0118879176 /NCGR_PEP_ID=MMETSP1163-20130328/19012_1 /TAXON_ID=124430 /ORGANISM="Phaeomonas parva, Strain CCMP2877" /LENGTH=46 /DNA_ID= /DNA_START= /DNA_END= /DNA_ORIENTATION=